MEGFQGVLSDWHYDCGYKVGFDQSFRPASSHAEEFRIADELATIREYADHL